MEVQTRNDYPLMKSIQNTATAKRELPIMIPGTPRWICRRSEDCHIRRQKPISATMCERV